MIKPKAKKHTTGANLIESKLPCPECGSSDALALYDDLHAFCFAHGKIVPERVLREHGMLDGKAAGTMSAAPIPEASAEIEQFIATAKPHPLKSRHLTLSTCKRWEYLVRKNPHKHTYEQLALYRDKSRRVVDIKVRTEAKDFFWVKGKQAIQLYGQHLWAAGGKYLTITEGEIDAMTVDQIFDKKYPVVSVPGGAAGALKAVLANLEWINSFAKVVLMFDMDEPGVKAAAECASVIAPGRAHIASLPEKDPNECLVKGLEEDVRNAFWNASKVKIGGVVDARTLSIKCRQKITVGRPWPWAFLQRWTFGKRPGEVYIVGSGKGMGKSDFMAEVAASAITGITKEGVRFDPAPFADFNFEAVDWKTKLLIAGKVAGRRFHLPHMPEFGFDPGWTEEELDATLLAMDTTMWDKGGRLYINEDGFGANWDEIVSRMRYLNKAEEVTEFAVDNVAAIVADMAEDDERKFLDSMFRQSANLSLELGATIHFVSHLTHPRMGPSHEEGGQVQLQQFRGSGGIGIAVSLALGLERNQQSEDPRERIKTTVRVVKDRLSSLYTGHTHALYYDQLTGTLDVENEG